MLAKHPARARTEAAGCGVPLHASVEPIFGGPLDISRLLFTGMRASAIVCVACQTINGGDAHVCKGCEGKLPAYFSSMIGSGKSCNAATTPKPAASSAALKPDSSWHTVGLTAVAVLLLFLAFAYWYSRVSTPGSGRVYDGASNDHHRVSRLHEAEPGSGARSTAESDGDPPVAGSKVFAAASPVASTVADARREAGQILQLSQSKNPRLQKATGTAAERPISSRVESHGQFMKPAASRLRTATVQRPGVADPLMTCRSLSLLARAICLNDRCAQSQLAGHPRCTEVLAQRRIDEARRNPVLSN